MDVDKLRVEHGADVNASDKAGCTPLHVALIDGHVEAIALLTQHGADVMDTVKVLVEHGSNVSMLTTHDCTPAYIAA